MYVISLTTSRLTVRDHFHRVSAKRVLQLLHWCMVCAQAFLSLATGLHGHEHHESQKSNQTVSETKLCVQELGRPSRIPFLEGWVWTGWEKQNLWLLAVTLQMDESNHWPIQKLSWRWNAILTGVHEQQPQDSFDGKSGVPSTTIGQYSSRNWQHWHTFTLFSNCCKIWTCPACTLQKHHVLHNPVSTY